MVTQLVEYCTSAVEVTIITGTLLLEKIVYDIFKFHVENKQSTEVKNMYNKLSTPKKCL